MIKMDDEIGLAILEELRKQNKLLHFQAKMLIDINGKDGATLELIKYIFMILARVHEVNPSDLGSKVDEEDSKNETLTDK